LTTKIVSETARVRFKPHAADFGTANPFYTFSVHLFGAAANPHFCEDTHGCACVLLNLPVQLSKSCLNSAVPLAETRALGPAPSPVRAQSPPLANSDVPPPA
jgi:hypothetical protein